MAKLGQKPNGIWFLDVQVPDESGGLRRQRISCETRDKDQAEAQRRDWLAGLHPKHPQQGGVVAPKGRAPVPEASTRQTPRHGGLTFNQWLGRCLSDPAVWGQKTAVKNHQSSVRILQRMVRDDLLLSELTNADLDRLVDALWERGYKPGSVKKLFGYVTKALRYGQDKGHVSEALRFPKVEAKSKPRERVLTLDEEDALFACIAKRQEDEPLRAWWHFEQLLTLLLDTGCRVGELLTSGPRNVVRRRFRGQDRQMKEGFWLQLFAHQTKTEKPRELPLSARAQAAIAKLNERQVKGLWFPWPKGSSGPIYMLDNLRKDMAERGYPIEDVVLHTMRHTCLTRLAEGGMDLLGLKDWAGHTDIKITASVYLHKCQSHIHWGADILNDLIGPNPSDGGIEEEDGTGFTMPEVLACGRERAEVGTPLLN